MSLNDAQMRHLGLDPKEVRKIARRIDRLGKDMRAQGLGLFLGGSSGLRPLLLMDSRFELVGIDVFPGEGGDGGDEDRDHDEIWAEIEDLDEDSLSRAEEGA